MTRTSKTTPSLESGQELGLLLVNLGTPDAPDPKSVRRYLRQFLMDERVLDIPAWRRFLLVHLLILPTRPKRSSVSYQKIWTDRGSPLLFHGEDLRDKVQSRVGDSMPVGLAMRYGSPSIGDALERMKRLGVRRLVVLPLYAQASEASLGSSLAELERCLSTISPSIEAEVVPPFFDHPSFLEAKVGMIQPVIERVEPDLVLFSYHGLPVRQLVNSAPGLGCMEGEGCCERPEARERCYRAQCFENARQLASRLALLESRQMDRQRCSYRVCFQSRLGRTPWIPPFTDEVLAQEARLGRRRIVVVTGFVADCLETLEEIAIGGREIFLEHGGEELVLAPAPNAQDSWVDVVVDLVTETGSRMSTG